jgi:hypothetical protein
LLSRIEEVWGANASEKAFSTRLEGLMRRAYEKTGKRVVVLVDEYDKPLMSLNLNFQKMPLLKRRSNKLMIKAI